MSDPVNGRDRCVDRMLSRHPESLEIARSLSTVGERFIVSLEIHPNDPLQVLPTCLVIRQISGLRSLCLLAVNGFFNEAIGHQRSLMEALARITALTKKPDLVHDYLAQDILNRIKLLKDILNFRSDWGPEIPRDPSDEHLREQIAQAQSRLDDFERIHGRKARDVKTFDWAQTGDVAHLLLGRFVISSQALHFSPKSLEHLFVIKDDQLKEIRIGPEDKNIDDLILTSCKYVFVGIQSLANALSVGIPDDIEALYRRYEALHERMASEALDTAPDP